MPSKYHPLLRRVVGERIRVARMQDDLSLGDLAGMTGIDKTTIWSYEAVKYLPSIPALLRISEALEIEVMSIVHHDDFQYLDPGENDE